MDDKDLKIVENKIPKSSKLEFRFGVYTDVTELAHRVNPEYIKANVIKVFVCPDTWDTWLCRIIEGYDEDYNRCEGSYILERNKIEHDVKGQNITVNSVKRMLIADDFSNWDMLQGDDLGEMIHDNIDSGYGILNYQGI